MNRTSLSSLLVDYLITKDPNEKSLYAEKINAIYGYQGLLGGLHSEVSIELEDISTKESKDIVNTKKTRLQPGTKKAEIPRLHCIPPPFSSSITDIPRYCDELLQSRRVEQECLSTDYDAFDYLCIPQEVPRYTWFYCILKDIIRDCQRVAALLSEDGCRENCRNMTSTDGIEYKCSCHERNVLCCAQDYYYHNINFSTMKLNEIYPLISAGESNANMIENEMKQILRRLYRLYLHAYFHHFSVFQPLEISYHIYEKFYYFVIKSELLTESDLRPFVSIDEIKSNIYNISAY